MNRRRIVLCMCIICSHSPIGERIQINAHADTHFNPCEQPAKKDMRNKKYTQTERAVPEYTYMRTSYINKCIINKHTRNKSRCNVNNDGSTKKGEKKLFTVFINGQGNLYSGTLWKWSGRQWQRQRRQRRKTCNGALGNMVAWNEVNGQKKNSLKKSNFF